MKKFSSQSFLFGLALGVIVAATPALANSNASDTPTPPERSDDVEVFDPLEPVNRIFFGLNDVVDLLVVRPVVAVWKGVVPQPLQNAVSNVFGNLDDAFAGASHALQGNGDQAANDFGRVVVNTTVGIGGLFDVASGMGLEKTRGDFGQTLGVWGFPAGPYLVLPLMGPSTARETVGRVGRAYLDPRNHMDPEWGYSLMALEFVQNRADSPVTDTLLDASSFDKYAFVRNLYLQRRAALVRAGLEGSGARE